MYPIHEKPAASFSFDRLDIFWERYPQYHERTTFGTLDDILEEHETYQKDFDEELRDEYLKNDYGRFLVNLSWSDLAYRYATKELITASPPFQENPYMASFMDQFSHLDTDHNACFLFPESFVSQFFVIMEVCKRAESFHPVRPIFPDEKKIHYLAVFDPSPCALLMSCLLCSCSRTLAGLLI